MADREAAVNRVLVESGVPIPASQLRAILGGTKTSVSDALAGLVSLGMAVQASGSGTKGDPHLFAAVSAGATGRA